MRQLRETKGLTQEQLAERAQAGLNVMSISERHVHH
jgi:transcriptional regulator with XRE-family HTH domain